MEYVMIDPDTIRHMMLWIDRQFGTDQPELTAAMIDQYETDPDTYGREGWWRCHDDMIAAGDHTL
jgi:hypothetical protein